MIADARWGTRCPTLTPCQDCGGCSPTACSRAVAVCCQAGPLAPGQSSTATWVAPTASSRPPSSQAPAPSQEPRGTRARKAGHNQTTAAAIAIETIDEPMINGTDSTSRPSGAKVLPAARLTRSAAVHTMPAAWKTPTATRASRLRCSRPAAIRPSPMAETSDGVTGTFSNPNPVSSQLARGMWCTIR